MGPVTAKMDISNVDYHIAKNLHHRKIWVLLNPGFTYSKCRITLKELDEKVRSILLRRMKSHTPRIKLLVS